MSIRGSQVSVFMIDDSSGAAKDLKDFIDGEAEVAVRSGPALQRRTRGGDAAARYVSDAPLDVQLDIPLIPSEDTDETIAVVLANRSTARTVDFQIEVGTSNKGFKISGEFMIDEITMTYQRAEGQAGFVLPLKPTGSAITITTTTD